MLNTSNTRAAVSRRARAFTAGALVGLAACAPDAPTSPKPNAARAAAAPTPDVAATPWADRFAYAWSEKKSTPGPWTPTLGYKYSSAGGAIVFTRLAVGAYSVDFEQLGRPGIAIGNLDGYGSEVVVATAYADWEDASPSVTCNAVSWFSWLTTNRLTARVDCADLVTGQPVDSRFNILAVGDRSLPARSAFAVADKPTAPSYIPDARFRFTSGPGFVGVSHNASVGDWDWRMGTGSPLGAIHLVNAHRGLTATTAEVCKVAEYKSLGPRVRCFDTDGQPRDVPYQVLQVSRGRPGRRFGFAWADRPTSTTPYAPHSAYTYNSSGGVVEVERAGVGAYVVRFKGLQRPQYNQHEHVQVTAFGPAFSACSIEGWDDETDPFVAPGLVVWLRCTDQNGQPADTRFNVMVIE